MCAVQTRMSKPYADALPTFVPTTIEIAWGFTSGMGPCHYYSLVS